MGNECVRIWGERFRRCCVMHAPVRRELPGGSQREQMGQRLFGQYLSGTIDEVCVYSRALSAAQVQADMAPAISPEATAADPDGQ